MTILHTGEINAKPSAREKLSRDFAHWVATRAWPNGSRVFNAPYGVIEGLSRGKRSRSVTFGVARRSDIELAIYSINFMVLNDSRFGRRKFTDIKAVKAALMEDYDFPAT